MKKMFLISAMLLTTCLTYAAQQCPGKQVPFSLANDKGNSVKSIDMNNDGKAEKFFMCPSSKDATKTLFRIYDGKTNKIILSVVLDIVPEHVVADYIDYMEEATKNPILSLNIFYSEQKPYSIIQVARHHPAMEFGAPPLPYYNFIFKDNVFLLQLETYTNEWNESNEIDHTEIAVKNFMPCGDNPCIVVYKFTGLQHPVSDMLIEKHLAISEAYTLYKNKLKKFYKKGDDTEVFFKLQSILADENKI